MLDAARRGQVNAVLVWRWWKFDRFGRSALDLLASLAFVCSTRAGGPFTATIVFQETRGHDRSELVGQVDRVACAKHARPMLVRPNMTALGERRADVIWRADGLSKVIALAGMNQHAPPFTMVVGA